MQGLPLSWQPVKDPVPKGQSEVPGPLLGKRCTEWDRGKHEIEPGEVEQTEYDFVLDATLQTVEVYT